MFTLLLYILPMILCWFGGHMGNKALINESTEYSTYRKKHQVVLAIVTILVSLTPLINLIAAVAVLITKFSQVMENDNSPNWYNKPVVKKADKNEP